jgi:hypothetical protein
VSVLEINAGPYTDELLEYVLKEIDDETLDGIDVQRKPAPSEGLANEFVTAAAVLTLSTTALIACVRLIERWMEKEREKEQLKIVLNAFDHSLEAGITLADVAKSNNGIAVSYGLHKEPSIT